MSIFFKLWITAVTAPFILMWILIYKVGDFEEVEEMPIYQKLATFEGIMILIGLCALLIYGFVKLWSL